MPPTSRSSTGRVGFTANFAAHVDRTLSVDERRVVREHYLNDVAKHTSRGLRRGVLMDPIGSIRFRFYLDGQLVRQETTEVTTD